MDWRFNTIWFDQLGEDVFFQKDYKKNIIATKNKEFESAEYAIIWHLKEKSNSFETLPASDKLLYLQLNWANIKNFDGLEKYRNLKRLELHYCVKLENDFGLSRLSKSLEFLHIDTSRKFNFTDELLQLKKLKVLRLNACGSVENLDFLKEFPNLIDFRFVNTNVVNGNLYPIIEHPTIRDVGFLNKNHYNYKDEKIKKELENKGGHEYKTIVYKKQFSTFRYNYE